MVEDACGAWTQRGLYMTRFCVVLSMDFLSDFEMMLQRKKSLSGKRRRNRDGGTFISDADDVVSAMIGRMNEAAEVKSGETHIKYNEALLAKGLLVL